ncbi:MAG TPA: S41 family peptidase [Puia sp.]|nr:S41 family peptidase [Puia sp.]
MKRTFSALLIPFLLFFLESPAQTTRSTAEIAYMITRMAEIYHVQPRVVDKSFSSDLFSQMIRALDADKIYFNEEDILKLSAFKYTLDDQLLNKKDDFLKLLTTLYTKKINLSDSILDILSKSRFNLNLNETYTVSEDNSFSPDEIMRRTKIYKLVKRNILETLVDIYDEDSTKTNITIDSLEPRARKKVCHAFKRDILRIRQTNRGLSGFVNNAWCESVASCYDPHTEFFSPGKKEEFQGELGDKQLQFGFSLGDGKDATEITHLKPGSPAYKSGLIHEGDQILALQWDGNEEVDVSDGSTEEVNAFISGDHGKSLTLTLKKSDGTMRKVTLQREESTMDDNNSRVRSFILNGSHRVGFISLPAFYTDWNGEEGGSNGCADDVAKEIIKLKKENIEGLILDLRYNGGGSMLEAIALAGIFIDYGPVGMTRDKEGKVFTMKDVNRGSVYDGPLILLINGFTASASEMLAGTLQDYHRALIIGTPSFGKATAQVVLPLDTMFDEQHLERMKTANNFIKITIDRLFRVNGTSAQQTGVIPDIFLPDYSETQSEREKTLPFSLPNITIDANKYYHPYPAIPLEPLKSFSKSFMDTSQFFISFNRYLDILVQGQVARDQVLVFNDMLESRRQIFRDLNDEEISINNLKPPYEIEWNQYEKLRMQADEDLRKSNTMVTQVLTRDTGILLGYELAYRMSGN